MRHVAINEDGPGTVAIANVAELTTGNDDREQDIVSRVAFSSDKRHIGDFSFIKNALKTLCREHGLERDRRATVEIAALLLALVKEGVLDEEQLKESARERWEDASTISPSSRS